MPVLKQAVDTDLASAVESWAELPPAIRAGIVALVKAAGS
jgi:predicted nucleotidyltransferase